MPFAPAWASSTSATWATFVSPVPTPLARFGHGPGPLYGEAAIEAYRGTGSGLGAGQAKVSTVFGRIPVQPDAVAGNYSDTITVTITY